MSDRARNDEDHGILDSVRRILADTGPSKEPSSERDDGILNLDHGMMIDPPAPTPADTVPAPGQASPAADPVVGGDAARSAGRSLASLRAASREQAHLRVSRGGPTIEDLVRDEMRPLLREWLDAHLPPLVERLVRAEIARIAGSED